MCSLIISETTQIDVLAHFKTWTDTVIVRMRTKKSRANSVNGLRKKWDKAQFLQLILGTNETKFSKMACSIEQKLYLLKLKKQRTVEMLTVILRVFRWSDVDDIVSTSGCSYSGCRWL